MNERDAILFAAKCQDWLNIPSYVCEIIEHKLMAGNYEEVCNFMIQRIKEAGPKTGEQHE